MTGSAKIPRNKLRDTALKGGRLPLAVLPVSIAALGFAGCGGSGGAAGGTALALGTLKPLQAHCDGPVNGYGAIDFSGSGRGDGALVSQRFEIVRDLANEVAACTGFMKIVVFSASTSDTVPLGEQEFAKGSGTTNARLIKAGHDLDGLFLRAKKNLPQATRRLTSGATEVLPQLGLAGQFQQQRRGGTLRVAIATDGIATAGPDVMKRGTFTVSAARVAGTRITVPSLAGAKVRFAGIGRLAEGKQPPTEFTNAVTTYYQTACARTKATCLVTNDYTKGG